MKKVQIVFAVMLITASFPIYAQNKLVDSLKNALAMSKDENRYEILWGLAFELYDVDNSQAVLYAKDAFPLALASGDTGKIVKSGRILSQLLRRVDKVQESLDILDYIFPISKRHRIESEIQMILNGLALGYIMKGEYDKSLQYNFESLARRERIGDKAKISVALNNVGVVFSNMEMYDQALHYYLRCLELKKEVHDKFDYDRLLVNIGLCYMHLEDYVRAKKYFEDAIRPCQNACNDQIMMEVCDGFGAVHYHEGNYVKAKYYTSKSLQLARKLNSQFYQLVACEQLARVYIASRDLGAARKFLDSAENLPAKGQYTKRQLYLFEVNAEYHAKAGNFHQAYVYQKKYSDLSTEIFIGRVNSNMAKSQIQFFENEYIEKIDTQERVLKLQQDAIERQQLLNALVGIVAILTIGLTGVLFYLNRQGRRVNEKLDLRVRERTAELEESRDLLQHAHDRQEIIMGRVISDLASALGTLKGLVTIATSDLSEEKVRHFRELETTIGELSANVKSAVQEKF